MHLLPGLLKTLFTESLCYGLSLVYIHCLDSVLLVDNLQVIFVDVWKYPQQAEKYNIRVIPTQIFLNADGKELYRHQGFLSKKDILAKWKEFGFDFSKKE